MNGSSPLRTCLGCSRTRPRKEMARMVRGPEGAVHFDLAGHLPGRGAYICPDQVCLASALKPKKLSRAFRKDTPAPSRSQAAEALGRQYRLRILGLVGMAARSGGVVAGRDAVLRALAGGRPCLLIAAGDLAGRSGNELSGHRGDVPLLRIGTIEELGSALGRPGCGTAAVTNRPLAKAISDAIEQAAAFGLVI